MYSCRIIVASGIRKTTADEPTSKVRLKQSGSSCLELSSVCSPFCGLTLALKFCGSRWIAHCAHQIEPMTLPHFEAGDRDHHIRTVIFHRLDSSSAGFFKNHSALNFLPLIKRKLLLVYRRWPIGQ